MAKNTKKSVAEVASKFGVVGRASEMEALLHCVSAGKHVLLEGPVGVGKTFLVNAVAHWLDRGVIRVDGDSRFTEQKLTGWFDPPTVLKKGYTKDAYFDGPLSEALRKGSILFINELNRMPEGVQNVLLPALDERRIEVPRVGTLGAAPGFCVIATQNPREFVATSHLSEALLDRFELITLDYQSEEEEREILRAATLYKEKEYRSDELADWCLRAVRATRSSPLFKRGASIRAGISIYDIAARMGGTFADFERACRIAIPTRVELSEEGAEVGMKSALEEIAKKKR
ncbi:MAG: MoxR family ATPase [Bdellovibrionales bacterium]|nr:MoxR family ATPase [Bdellovibrionales bacterium]